MRASSRIIVFVVILLFSIGATLPSFGLGLGDVKDKAKKKVEKRADKKVDNAMDDALDAAEGKGDGGSDEKKSEAKPAAAQKKEGEASVFNLKPGEGAWVNYDFVPGDKILFYEDYSKTRVGDVPRKLEFIKGNMEVAEWNGEKYLRLTAPSEFKLPLPATLPEQFTFETEMNLPNHHAQIKVWGGLGDAKAWHQTSYIYAHGNGRAGVGGAGGTTETMFPKEAVRDEMAKFKIMADGSYIKVYLNEQRVANIPNAIFYRDKFLYLSISANATVPVLLGDFRIAEGGRKFLYDELETAGRVATQGIYFDSGSDVLRPESTPTLTDIADMLSEHESLKLLIEGHTDSVGDDASNLDLSQRRAKSVKNYLVENHGIDGGRLETQGFGETNPVDTNDSPEGRQNNRRVELVKL